MSLTITTCDARQLGRRLRDAIGVCRAGRYTRLVYPDDRSIAEATGTAPGTSAFAHRACELEARIARDLGDMPDDAVVSALHLHTASGAVIALAAVQITFGTRTEAATAMTGQRASSIPSSRTYLGLDFARYLAADTPETALAEFGGHARIKDPTALVAAGLLDRDEACYVERHAGDLVLVEAYRRALRREAPPCAFVASTSPALVGRIPALAPLFRPLFARGLTIAPALLDNPARFDRDYFARWPAVLARAAAAAGVPPGGTRETIQRLVEAGFTDWHHLPELCLPYLVLNDGALAAAMAAVAADCAGAPIVRADRLVDAPLAPLAAQEVAAS